MLCRSVEFDLMKPKAGEFAVQKKFCAHYNNN
jgi:hypothetical protein